MDWRRLLGRRRTASQVGSGPAPLDLVLAYHEATKHAPARFARGPGYLDWATQPDPFRRWIGAPLVPLDHVPLAESPPFEAVFTGNHIQPQPLDRRFVSQLLEDSLAISAWKRAGGARWALRVNPSSGNLHPTEAYVVAPAIECLSDTPFIAHYAPAEHALEVRARLPPEHHAALLAELPLGTLLVGLTSVHWREAWKYGERAYRYCQHDVGHALACVALAAAAQGYRATLLDGLGSGEIALLLGLDATRGVEPEEPDLVLALHPRTGQSSRTAPPPRARRLPEEPLAQCSELTWHGRPNALSRDHVEWDAIDAIARATVRPPYADADAQLSEARARHVPTWHPLEVSDEPLAFRPVVHQRRSAVAMDARSGLVLDAFVQTLRRTLAGHGEQPYDALPWTPRVHLVVFVHRVAGLDPGLYVLVRAPEDERELRGALDPSFVWNRPAGCLEVLPFFLLKSGDGRGLASHASCDQAIAGDGCFSLGMLARFEPSLRARGPWAYPELFWECGAIGQALYLEAEALGLRATGIGCFYDDTVHAALGLRGRAWQSLYHFTVGGALDDPRISTEPAYGAAPP